MSLIHLVSRGVENTPTRFKNLFPNGIYIEPYSEVALVGGSIRPMVQDKTIQIDETCDTFVIYYGTPTAPQRNQFEPFKVKLLHGTWGDERAFAQMVADCINRDTCIPEIKGGVTAAMGGNSNLVIKFNRMKPDSYARVNGEVGFIGGSAAQITDPNDPNTTLVTPNAGQNPILYYVREPVFYGSNLNALAAGGPTHGWIFNIYASAGITFSELASFGGVVTGEELKRLCEEEEDRDTQGPQGKGFSGSPQIKIGWEVEESGVINILFNGSRIPTLKSFTLNAGGADTGLRQIGFQPIFDTNKMRFAPYMKDPNQFGGAWTQINDGALPGGNIVQDVNPFSEEGAYCTQTGLYQVLGQSTNPSPIRVGFGCSKANASIASAPPANLPYTIGIYNFQLNTEDNAFETYMAGSTSGAGMAICNYVNHASVNTNSVMGFGDFQLNTTQSQATGLAATWSLMAVDADGNNIRYDDDAERFGSCVVVQLEELPIKGFLGGNGGQAPILGIVPFPKLRVNKEGFLQTGSLNWIKLRNPNKICLNALTCKLTNQFNTELEGLNNYSNIWLKFRCEGGKH